MPHKYYKHYLVFLFLFGYGLFTDSPTMFFFSILYLFIFYKELIELIKELDLIKVFFPQEVSVLMDQNQSQNKTNIIERQIFFNNQKSIDLS